MISLYERVYRKFNEEIYGNIASVFHRCENALETIDYLYNDDWSGEGMYGKDTLYTIFNDSAIEDANLDMYGKQIIKFYVKDLQNFFIYSYKFFKKVYTGSLYKDITEENFKQWQADKFDINLRDIDFGDKNNKQCRNVNGLIYNAKDGDCLVLFKPTAAVPVAWKEVGKDWHKVELNKEYFSKAIYKNSVIDKNTEFETFGLANDGERVIVYDRQALKDDRFIDYVEENANKISSIKFVVDEVAGFEKYLAKMKNLKDITFADFNKIYFDSDFELRLKGDVVIEYDGKGSRFSQIKQPLRVRTNGDLELILSSCTFNPIDFYSKSKSVKKSIGPTCFFAKMHFRNMIEDGADD